MKNKLVAFCAMIFVASCAFAKQKFLSEPKKDEVILVGRISFETDMDREFLFNAMEVPEKKRNFQDVVVMPFFSKNYKYVEDETKHLKLAENKPKDIKKFDRQAWAVNGEYFFVKYSFDKKQRTIYLDNATLFIGASYTLPVGLPLNLKVVVPENEKFLYLGDFSYSAKGFGFDLSCAVSDEFEAAQFALNEVTKEEYSLCRANPQIFSEEESKHVRNRNWFVFYDEKDWYKTFKDVPLILETENGVEK